LRLIATPVVAEIGKHQRLYQYWGCTMPKRPAQFIAAIFVNLLAGAALAAASGSTAHAADDCVSAPAGVAPQGGHWYYRLDWPTRRHCWYVRKSPQAAPHDSAASASPVAPRKTAAAPPSVADARDEMPLPQARIAQDPGVAPAQGIPSVAAEAASPDQGTEAMQRSVVASRWPDPSEMNKSAATISAAPIPAPGNSVANPQSNPTMAKPAVALAAADSSSSKRSSPIPKLLTVIVGALSIVTVMGTSVLRSNSMRRIAIDRRPPPIYPSSVAGMAGADLHRDPRAADDPGRRIAQMLARLSQSAPG
jgi:hypothetical protein